MEVSSMKGGDGFGFLSRRRMLFGVSVTIIGVVALFFIIAAVVAGVKARRFGGTYGMQFGKALNPINWFRWRAESQYHGQWGGFDPNLKVPRGMSGVSPNNMPYGSPMDAYMQVDPNDHRLLMSSYQRQGHPPVFSNAAAQPTTLTDLNVPAAEAYAQLAAEAFHEDLDTLDGLRRWQDPDLFLHEPQSDNLFRYVDGYELKDDDPYLSNPMFKVPTGVERNVGSTVFEHTKY